MSYSVIIVIEKQLLFCVLILQEKLFDLSEIMINALTSFSDTYQIQIPTTDTEDTRFAQIIIGLVANLSTVDEGRRFFSQNNNGKNVTKLITSIVSRTLSPSGNMWKK